MAEFKKCIRNKLNELLEADEITKEEHAFMAVDFPVTPEPKTLSKTHKNYADIPPGRPTVAAIGSLTHFSIRWSFSPTSCYVRSNGLLSIQLPEEHSFSVTIDTESRCTNVPFQGGQHKPWTQTEFPALFEHLTSD